MKSYEAARNLTLTDPAVPTQVGPTLEPRRPYGRVTVVGEADAVTGTVGPSLTLRLQGSNDQSAWTDLGTGIVVSAAGRIREDVYILGVHRFLRLAVTAKAGTTPGLTGVDASIELERGK